MKTTFSCSSRPAASTRLPIITIFPTPAGLKACSYTFSLGRSKRPAATFLELQAAGPRRFRERLHPSVEGKATPVEHDLADSLGFCAFGDQGANCSRYFG